MMSSAGIRVFGGCMALLAAAKDQASAKVLSGRAKGAAALTRVFPVSPAMRKFLGVPEISRPQAVRKVWDYIKLHQLQNPTNKKEINCDERLKSIFQGKDKIQMMEISGLLSPHFIKSN